MGFTDLFSDLYSAFTFTELHAEAPEQKDEEEGGEDSKSDDDKKEGEDSEEGGEGKDGGDDDSGEDKDEGGEEGGDEGGDDEGEEEEEEEEEPEDPKPKLEDECAKSAQCLPLKHHYEDCAERVHSQHQNPNHKGPKEDCIEEFFHLQHCATQCAAPKLFRQLK